MKDNIKSFVYYGSENYISLSSLRLMVPGAYLFMSFIVLVPSIVLRKPIIGIIFLSLVIAYAIVAYTFHLWCPKPSFACRFGMSAFSSLSLSVIFQAWAYLFLLAVGLIDAWDILIAVAFQVMASVACFLIANVKIKRGAYLKKLSFKTTICVGGISSASFAGIHFSRTVLDGVSQQTASIIVMVCTILISVICSSAGTMHLMKLYFCKKYEITCDKNGDTISELLILEKKPRKSLPRRIWSFTWKALALILAIAILFGIYEVSQQPSI